MRKLEVENEFKPQLICHGKASVTLYDAEFSLPSFLAALLVPNPFNHCPHLQFIRRLCMLVLTFHSAPVFPRRPLSAQDALTVTLVCK